MLISVESALLILFSGIVSIITVLSVCAISTNGYIKEGNSAVLFWNMIIIFVLASSHIIADSNEYSAYVMPNYSFKDLLHIEMFPCL